MAVQIFEELLVRSGYGDLMVEPQLGRWCERRQILHRRAEDPDVGRMRFRPALERSKAPPPALAVGFFGRRAVGSEQAHIAVGIAADTEPFIAQEIHALAQGRLDIFE